MQVWSRQPTQCVFCAFRQSRLTAHPLRQIRELSRTAASREDTTQRERERPRKESRRRDDEYKPSAPGRRAYARGVELRDRRPRREPRLDDVDVDEDLELAIRMAMTQLSHRLTTRKSTSDAERTEMQELDPAGKSWPAFKASISALRKRAQNSPLQSSHRTLWNKLHKAKGKSKSHLQTELYFNFLDFTLKPMDTNDVREAASMPVDIRYPTEWYAGARKAQRVIHLHVGPTNSGKTYNALKRLQETKNGFYAGPLRLLAHEVYSRFRANGIPCDLITGDDVRLAESSDTNVYASTVEMVNTGRPVDVAVIDEIQMMASEDRGWAWTRAFLGANAKEVHLCGEPRVVPLIRELSASMGDTLRIHHYERLNPLRCMSRSLRGNLKQLRKGDCIVAFSIMQIHALKKQIELETGKRCAIVYGSLPPETRAEQADLFNDPDNNYDFLVASDAIGMGLNLSVKRIIFNSTTKFDGTNRVQLTIPQIKQIAGRAGRYRSAHQDKNKSTIDEKEENVGLVSSIDESDLPVIRAALQTEAPPLRKAGLIPPAEYLEEYAARLPAGIPFEYLMRKVAHTATLHPRFFLCDISDKLELARVTDDVPGLTIEQRVNITAAPAAVRDPRVAKCLKALARAIASDKFVTVADVEEIPLEILLEEPRPDRGYLESLEVLHKCLILYLWLSYRFITSLRDQPMAIHAKGLTEQKINWTLRAFSANPKLMERLRKLRAEQTNLDPQQFKADMPKAEGVVEIRDNQATMPAEAYESNELALGGIQYTEEDGPVHTEEGEESMAEHFAEPFGPMPAESTDETVAEQFAKPVGLGDPKVTGLDVALQEHGHASSIPLQSGETSQSLVEDLAESVQRKDSEILDVGLPVQEERDVQPRVARGETIINDLTELGPSQSQSPTHPDILNTSHHSPGWTDRPANRAGESLLTPEEKEVVDKEMQNVHELKPDRADAHPANSHVEGEIPTAKGPKAEVVDLTRGQVEQEEEVNQPRSASASG